MITLREYQSRAVNAIFHEWESVRSTLLVQPTGTGKTTVFCKVIERVRPKRALILAHREELIFQARRRVEDQVGIPCQIEMAEQSASQHYLFNSPVVAATVQTLISGTGEIRRMHKFKPQDFGLLVIDEGHHSVALSYKKIIEYFSRNPDLKILGVTATPDRADEEALGQIFETVADVYEILDAIHDGWLVPVDQQMVEIEGLDFSTIKTTAGDLNQGELATVMEAEKNLYGVCGSTLEIIGDRQTIVFTSSVRHAEMACEIFNRYRRGMAGWICGTTAKGTRRETMQRFSKGELQVLCNVGCITEGVDVPAAEVVIMARPTKSRSLYAQMAGRILRPLTGLVDSLSSPDERKAAIAGSVKPSALIIDFVGNSGRHRLITTADILGGNVSEAARELAIRIARESGGPVRMNEELDEAEKEIRRKKEEERKRQEERRAHLTAKVRFFSTHIDPFAVLNMQPHNERGWDVGKTLSLKQRGLLAKAGFNPDGMPYHHARQLIAELFRRWNNKLASIKQCAFLKRRGISFDPRTLTKTQASALIDPIAKRENWRKSNVSGNAQRV